MREWRRSLKRILVLALSVAVIGNSTDLSGFMVSAESAQVLEAVSGGDNISKQETQKVSDGDTGKGTVDIALMNYSVEAINVVPYVDLPGNEELFAGYVDKMFYGGFSFFGTSARETLGEVPGALYDELKSQIEAVAAGELASTEFAVNTAGLNVKTTYTAEDLGLESIYVGNSVPQDVVDAMWTQFLGQFEIDTVIHALLHDCPYELYWFDKTSGYAPGCDSISVSEESLSVSEFFVRFSVAGSYGVSDSDYVVDTGKTGAVSTAVTNAAAIVASYENKSDYEKLAAYRDEICAAVTYNQEAAENTNTPYGDPWQLIYVFDGDSTTNVVCEGYAKAFQYLFDMSTFSGDISCYTVTGQMAGGTGAGGHMWNIVTMEDGKNYLVDITNSDEDSVGAGGELFLGGTAGSIADGYTFSAGNQSVLFTYDTNTTGLWGTGASSILKLADTGYELSVSEDSIPLNLTVGDTVVITDGVVEENSTSGAGWCYDSATNTLTLSGGTISSATTQAIYSAGDINILVTGNTVVETTGETEAIGVYAAGNQKGQLAIEVKEGVEFTVSAEGNVGILVVGSLSLSGGTIYSSGSAWAIYSDEAVHVQGTNLNCEAGNYGVYSGSTMEIEDSTVSAVGQNANGIFGGISVCIKNSEVEAYGYGKGIYGISSVTIEDSYVVATDTSNEEYLFGLASDTAIAITGSHVEVNGSISPDPTTMDSVVRLAGAVNVVGDASLRADVVLAVRETLKLEEGAVLNVPNGVTLDVTSGMLEISEGSSLAVAEGGTFVHNHICNEEGKCEVCGISCEVMETDSDGTVRYYENFEELFVDKIYSKTDVKLTLLKDVSVEYQEPTMLMVTGEVTLQLNGKTLELKATSISVSGNMRIWNGTLSSTHPTFALRNTGYMGLEEVKVSNDVGTMAIMGLTDSSLAVEGGSVTGKTAGICSQGTVTISGNPIISGAELGDLEVWENTKIILAEAPEDGRSYSVFAETTVHRENFVVAENGVKVKEGWFTAAKEGYVVVTDENNNKVSLMKSFDSESISVVMSSTSTGYTGIAIKPEFEQIFWDNYGLTENVDFTLSYRKGDSDVDTMVNAGTYTVVLTGKGAYYGTLELEFEIEKAMPVLNNVSSQNTLYNTTPVSEVVLTAEGVNVSGILELDGVTELTVGTKEYNYKFTPTDLDNYQVVTGKVSLTVLENALSKIVLMQQPSKLSYTHGDELDITGACVMAYYEDGSSKDVTADVSYTRELIAGQTELVLSYSEKRCTISGLTVARKLLNLENLSWSGFEFEYDGTEKSVTLQGDIPEGVVITYTGNKATDAGLYDAKADFALAEGFSGEYYEITGGENFGSYGWWIAPKYIGGGDVTYILGDSLTYNGEAQTHEVVSVSCDGLNVTYEVTGNVGTEAGEYTLRVIGNGNFEGNIDIPWSIAKKDISQAVLTLGENKTYSGMEQTMEATVGLLDGLVLTYDITGNKATNAGNYEVIITGNGNFTGSVKKDWRIVSKSIENAQVVLGSSLSFNGEEQTQSISSVTVDGFLLSVSDYEVSDNRATDAGDYMLTITGKGNFAGTATMDYAVAKGQAPLMEAVEKYYLYQKGTDGRTVSADIGAILPQRTKATEYILGDHSAEYVTDAMMDTEGVLTYKVTSTGNVGDSTTLVVTVKSDNYEDITVNVVIKLTDKFVTAEKVGAEVAISGDAELTYGKKLSELELNTDSAVFVAEQTGEVVEGTLTWNTPDMVLEPGEASVQWKFTPEDTDSYTELTGNLCISVKKAAPSVSTPAVSVVTYNPAVSLAQLALIGNNGSHVIGGSTVEVEGCWSWKDGSAIPTVNNRGYEVIFTPTDTAKYVPIEVNVEVDVVKAVPYIQLKPVAEVLTEGESLSAAALSGGKAVYAEGSSQVVEGTFSWKEGSLVPSLEDSQITEYTVVFTPTDASNYKSVETTVTVEVEPVPSTPTEPTPSAPPEPTPSAPAEPTPSAPAEPTPSAPAEPSTPVEPTPSAPAAPSTSAEPTPSAPAAPSTSESDTPSGQPFLQNEAGQQGWDVIRSEVAQARNGDAIIVNMNGATTVPGDIFDKVKGEDITLVFHMSNGLSWTINGQSVTADKVDDIDFGVTSGTNKIPVNIVNRVTGENFFVNISLDYSGEFGLTAILNINVNPENEGLFANLFYYNEVYGYMQFMGADEINERGIAHLAFTHASEYTIVIDDTIMGAAFTSPKTDDVDVEWNPWWFAVAVAFAMGIGYAGYRRKREVK